MRSELFRAIHVFSTAAEEIANYQDVNNEYENPKLTYQELIEDQGDKISPENIKNVNAMGRLAYRGFKALLKSLQWFVAYLEWSEEHLAKGNPGVSAEFKQLKPVQDFIHFLKNHDYPPDPVADRKLETILRGPKAMEEERQQFYDGLRPWHPLMKSIDFSIQERAGVAEQVMEDVKNYYEDLKIMYESWTFQDVALQTPSNFNWPVVPLGPSVDPISGTVGQEMGPLGVEVKRFMQFMRQCMQEDLSNLHRLISEYDKIRVVL